MCNLEVKLDIKSRIESVKFKISSFPEDVRSKTRKDDEFILKFLYVKKFNIEETAKRIQKYIKRLDRLRIIQGIRLKDYSKPITHNFITVLKNRIHDTAVIYLNFQNWDIEAFLFRDINLAGLFLVEELVSCRLNQKKGMHTIVNFEGFLFSHLKQMNVIEVKNSLELLMMGLPARVLGVHFVNFPRLLWPVSKVIKLLPTKLQRRIQFHDDIQSLHKVLCPEKLPRSLGGCLNENEAIDEIFINNLLETNPVFDSYWRESLNLNE